MSFWLGEGQWRYLWKGPFKVFWTFTEETLWQFSEILYTVWCGIHYAEGETKENTKKMLNEDTKRMVRLNRMYGVMWMEKRNLFLRSPENRLVYENQQCLWLMMHCSVVCVFGVRVSWCVVWRNHQVVFVLVSWLAACQSSSDSRPCQHIYSSSCRHQTHHTASAWNTGV